MLSLNEQQPSNLLDTLPAAVLHLATPAPKRSLSARKNGVFRLGIERVRVAVRGGPTVQKAQSMQ
jgi:hypothetical protein